MNKKLLVTVIIAFFLFSVIMVPQIAKCQTATTQPALTPTPTGAAQQGSALNLLLIVGIVVVVVAVIGAASAFIVMKRRVNEKSLRKVSARVFEEWVIKRFNGKPSDPSSGVNGFTQGGQPLLIIQSDQVSLAEVEDFVKVLVKGRAQKGTIVALNFDKDAIEGKISAMDNGIELQLLPINELLNKRFAKRMDSLALSSVTFEAPLTGIPENPLTETRSFERTPNTALNEGLNRGSLFQIATPR